MGPRRSRRDLPALLNGAAAVDVAHNGLTAAATLDMNAYDVVVLDRDLRGIRGDRLCGASGTRPAADRPMGGAPVVTTTPGVGCRIAGAQRPPDAAGRAGAGPPAGPTLRPVPGGAPPTAPILPAASPGGGPGGG